ncbi:30S ribosomal protein S4 [uncultured archaeon]|nr:30S ribosomal protein S4 [uncultured archaeon]
MGDPRRLIPKAETPRRVWDADRIKNENQLKSEYGLRRTRELWTAVSELKKARRSARTLLSLGDAGREKGAQVIAKLQRLGIAKGDMRLEDVLGLSIRDFLERRLQTLVKNKGLARTSKQARQLIVHGFIAVGGRRVTIPSYMVTLSEEPTISYYKAIDIEPPQQEGAPKGAAGQRAARGKMASEAAEAAPESPAADAPKPAAEDSA